MKIAYPLVVLLALLVAGSAGLGSASATEAGQTLEEAFRGQATGVGRFKSTLAGVDRGFVVTTKGRGTGGQFVLEQVFRFDNGALDRRTWRFRKTGPKTYVGTREDVVGLAKVRVDDDAIRMSYDLITRGKNGSKLQLHFEDTIRRSGRDSIVNKGVISMLGMNVGSVDVAFKRQKLARKRGKAGVEEIARQ
ncbi:DUF3833 family protein [Kaistia terrae]|jgi:hypothetical protein|uniref:DUF3833 family protein n=1 Tax=Kaistia terrae TaxID=537017 RepID=A0ABW0PXA9_9HYPH|nr:DUF3833 family protein [Kaistia terrae]MCX5580820.1 DUF3833 family protein [Kaistia terrae]